MNSPKGLGVFFKPTNFWAVAFLLLACEFCSSSGSKEGWTFKVCSFVTNEHFPISSLLIWLQIRRFLQRNSFVFFCGFFGFFFFLRLVHPLFLVGDLNFLFGHQLESISMDWFLKTPSLLLWHPVLNPDNVSHPHFFQQLVPDLAGCACHFLPQPPIIFPWGHRPACERVPPAGSENSWEFPGQVTPVFHPKSKTHPQKILAEHKVGEETAQHPLDGWNCWILGGKLILGLVLSKVWGLSNWFSCWRLCHRHCTEKEWRTLLL